MNYAGVFHVNLGESFNASLIEWKSWCARLYGNHGGIKKHFQELIKQDIEKMRSENKEENKTEDNNGTVEHS